jgi:hypothetical protein
MIGYNGQLTCFACNGTGIVDGLSCAACSGSGLVTPRTVHEKILSASLALATGGAAKFILSYKIVEVIDATEYAALVDAAKDGLRIIMSCGVVDLDHTGQIYANLMAIFGSSPITKAAIEAL